MTTPRCPACLTAQAPRRAFTRCAVCGSRVKWAQLRPDDPVGAHDAAYFAPDAPYEMNSAALLDRYLAFIDRHRPLRAAQVIDVGCGDSEAATAVGRYGAAYTGVEPSREPRERLQAEGTRVVANLGELAGQPPADVALMFEVIEHLPVPDDVLARVRERLVTGGVLFITTPNADGLQARALGGAWAQARNETHVCLYTPAGLRDVLARNGFAVRTWQRRLAFPRRSPLRRISDGALQRVGLDGGLRALASAV